MLVMTMMLVALVGTVVVWGMYGVRGRSTASYRALLVASRSLLGYYQWSRFTENIDSQICGKGNDRNLQPRPDDIVNTPFYNQFTVILDNCDNRLNLAQTERYQQTNVHNIM